MIISQVNVTFNANVREFNVPSTATLLRISLADGEVKVEGRMTADESYVQLSGVTAALESTATAKPGINTYDIAGMKSLKLTNIGATGSVVSTMLE